MPNVLKYMAKTCLGLFNLEYKYGRIVVKTDKISYHKPVSDLPEGNTVISSAIKRGEPLLVARIGLTELKLLLNYLHFKNKTVIRWHEAVKEQIWLHSGLFPTEDAYLELFAKTYLEAISVTDIMGVWYNEGENEVIRRYCPGAELIPLESIEPYFFDHPWSKMLEGKKVLVVHPFEDSVKYQYTHHREQLFRNRDVLPQFDLKTVKAIQTLTYNTSSFSNWVEALDYMKSRIAEQDFDIALIGAGGYGLPLGAYVKSLGKQAIHMGGATQILFGIRGKRWEDRDQFRELFNEYWKRPYQGEQPDNAMLHENGAYW